MPNEQSRVTVVQALADKLGPEVAAALMECVPPFAWTEVATKTDLRDLEQRLLARIDGRLEGFDGRMEGFDGRMEGFDGRMVGLKFELLAAIQAQTNRTIKWMVGSVFAAVASVGGATAGIAALVR